MTAKVGSLNDEKDHNLKTIFDLKNEILTFKPNNIASVIKKDVVIQSSYDESIEQKKVENKELINKVLSLWSTDPQISEHASRIFAKTGAL